MKKSEKTIAERFDSALIVLKNVAGVATDLLVIALLAGVFAMFARSAFASDMYVGANVQRVSVQNSDHDEKVGLGVTVGTDLIAGFSAEAEVGTLVYNRNTEKLGTLDVSHLLGTVAYDIPVTLPLNTKPFVGGVVGVVKGERNDIIDDRFSFAYGATAGVVTPINEKFDVVGSYRYLQTDAGILTKSSGKRTDMSTHSVGVGVRYHF